jgi:hypothetical protein
MLNLLFDPLCFQLSSLLIQEFVALIYHENLVLWMDLLGHFCRPPHHQIITINPKNMSGLLLLMLECIDFDMR